MSISRVFIKNCILSASLLERPKCILTLVRCVQNTRRNVSTSAACMLKEIQVRSTDAMTVVEGIVVESERKDKLLPADENGYCPMCPHRLGTTVKYTDVLILSQFLRPDGCCLPRTATGLCYKAQCKLQRLVHQAQRAGLMPELRPDHKSGEPRNRTGSNYKWKKYNTYYEE